MKKKEIKKYVHKLLNDMMDDLKDLSQAQDREILQRNQIEQSKYMQALEEKLRHVHIEAQVYKRMNECENELKANKDQEGED